MTTSHIAGRGVRRVAPAPRRAAAPGFLVAQLHPSMIDGGMGPFLQIDAFSLAEPVFAPHPHAGFSAVTYPFDESPIGFINRDTLGQVQRIAPGALHWTVAGRGVQHEEVPERLGTPAIGLQMFIDLPRESKQMAPTVLHLDPERIPRWRGEGGVVRVVAGECNGTRSPLSPPTPHVLLLDATLTPDGRFELELDELDEIFLWVTHGQVQVLGREGMWSLGAFDLAGLDIGPGPLVLSAGSAGARLVIAGGRSLRQPVVARGPFVMDSETALQDAIARYASGRMGRLAKTVYGADRQPLPPMPGDVAPVDMSEP